MKKTYSALLSFIALWLTVSPLAVLASDLTLIVDLNERINVAGVSLLPPQEKGWKYIKKHPARTEFGRLGANSSQSFTGMVVLSRLPDIKSKSEFYNLMSKQRSRDSSDTRYESILNKENISKEKDTIAFRFHTKYKDFGANNKPSSSGYLIIEDFGIILQHPKDKNIAVYIALSQRSLPSDSNANFEKLALEFINNANLLALEL